MGKGRGGGAGVQGKSKKLDTNLEQNQLRNLRSKKLNLNIHLDISEIKSNLFTFSSVYSFSLPSL